MKEMTSGQNIIILHTTHFTQEVTIEKISLLRDNCVKTLNTKAKSKELSANLDFLTNNCQSKTGFET